MVSIFKKTADDVHDRRGRPDKVTVEKVFKITCLRGEGTDYDPCRYVTLYFDMEGNFLFEKDDIDQVEQIKVSSFD